MQLRPYLFSVSKCMCMAFLGFFYFVLSCGTDDPSRDQRNLHWSRLSSDHDHAFTKEETNALRGPGGGGHGGGFHDRGYHDGPWIPAPWDYNPYPPYPPYPPGTYTYPFPTTAVFITSFDASPAQIYRGEAVPLTWAVTGAARVSIDGLSGYINASGAQTVYPAQTTIYTLRTYDVYGVESGSRVLQVNVSERPPAISAFWAERTQISKGESSTLHFSTSHCREVQLIVSGDTTGQGTYGCTADIQVSPQATSVYTIRVVGLDYQTLQGGPVTISVNVPPQKPVVDFFYVNPSTIKKGESAQLHWSVQKSTRVEITGVSDSVGPLGSMSVTPSSTATYILRAYGENGGVTEIPVTLNVSLPIPQPTVDTFEPEPAAILPGQTATLRWNTSYCERAEILEDHLRPVPCQGTLVDTPASTKSYTLRIYGSTGLSASKMITVQVQNPAKLPSIDQFYASSSKIVRGQPVTIYWNTSHTKRVTFSGAHIPKRSPSGAHTFYPKSSLAVRINAYDSHGQLATSIVSIAVSTKDKPSIGYFYADKPGLATIGKPYKLKWLTHNCAEVNISKVEGPLPNAGSIDVTVDKSERIVLRCLGFDNALIESSLKVNAVSPNASSSELTGALLDVMRGIK